VASFHGDSIKPKGLFVEITELAFVHGQEGGFLAVEVEFDDASGTIAVLFDQDLSNQPMSIFFRRILS
jgi:hypothetical protein